MKHAFVRAIARDIGRGAEACVLERRRDAALSCTAEFKVLTSDDDIFFEAYNARERVAADYACGARQNCMPTHLRAHDVQGSEDSDNRLEYGAEGAGASFQRARARKLKERGRGR